MLPLGARTGERRWCSRTRGDSFRPANRVGHDRAVVDLRRGAVPSGPAAEKPFDAGLALYDQAEALSLTEPEAARDRYERAIGLAQSAGRSFIEGIALVGLASLLGRSGRPGTALPQFLAIIDRWYDMGIWHHQWTTLRNLVQLLLRIGCSEDAAVLIHAIEASTTAATAFGTDAERMADATDALQTALGECGWSSALARGAALSDNDAVIFARDAISRAINAAGHDQPSHRPPDRSTSSRGT